MSEIKFRAWTIKRQEWHYFTLSMIANWPKEADGFLDYEDWSQYINQKDKDDKEVYVRDIIEIGNFEEPIYKIVRFVSGGFTTSVNEDIVMPSSRKIRIAGNIYDNPKLMKKLMRGVNK